MRANQNRQLLIELSSSKNNIVGLLCSSSSRFPIQLCFVDHSIGSLSAGRIDIDIDLHVVDRIQKKKFLLNLQNTPVMLSWET